MRSWGRAKASGCGWLKQLFRNVAASCSPLQICEGNKLRSSNYHSRKILVQLAGPTYAKFLKFLRFRNLNLYQYANKEQLEVHGQSIDKYKYTSTPNSKLTTIGWNCVEHFTTISCRLTFLRFSWKPCRRVGGRWFPPDAISEIYEPILRLQHLDNHRIYNLEIHL